MDSLTYNYFKFVYKEARMASLLKKPYKKIKIKSTKTPVKASLL